MAMWASLPSGLAAWRPGGLVEWRPICFQRGIRARLRALSPRWGYGVLARLLPVWGWCATTGPKPTVGGDARAGCVGIWPERLHCGKSARLRVLNPRWGCGVFAHPLPEWGWCATTGPKPTVDGDARAGRVGIWPERLHHGKSARLRALNPRWGCGRWPAPEGLGHKAPTPHRTNQFTGSTQHVLQRSGRWGRGRGSRRRNPGPRSRRT